MNVSSATMMSSLPKRMNLLAVALLAANLAGLASADLVFSAGFSDNSVLQRSSSDGALKRGSVALSLCTAAHLLYTIFANRFGTSIFLKRQDDRTLGALVYGFSGSLPGC